MLSPENRELSIVHERELTYILSKFNEDFIYTSVVESLNTRIRYYDQSIPNIVTGYEQMFKQILAEFPDSDYQSQILTTRENVYSNIIRILCNFYQMEYNDYDQGNLYTSAGLMYTLFVSGFQASIINFFVNFIIKEKDGLYNSLDTEYLKSKNLGALYSKKVYADEKIGAICSCLEQVVSTICSLGLSFYDFLDIAWDKNSSDITRMSVDYLESVLKSKLDFIQTYIYPLFMSTNEYSVTLMTSIRLGLQNIAKSTIVIDGLIDIDLLKGEE